MSKRILSGIVGLVCLLSGCRKAVNVETNHIPLFHFTTVMNWTGEPAGLVYDDELYHLFYQYNPSGNVFGNIHWGHAVSRVCFDGSEIPSHCFLIVWGILNPEVLL